MAVNLRPRIRVVVLTIALGFPRQRSRKKGLRSVPRSPAMRRGASRPGAVASPSPSPVTEAGDPT
jgi:hypothetical protein